MNTLERHGLLSLLRQAVPDVCPVCEEFCGHKADCGVVRFLRDIEAVLAEVGGV